MITKLNIAKLNIAIDAYEPKSLMEAMGIDRLRRLARQLPVAIEQEIEDGEDYYDILTEMDWGDEAQRRQAERDCGRVVDLLGSFRLAGDGSNLGTAIVPMPRRPDTEAWGR